MKVDNIKPHVDLFGFPVRHGFSIVPVKEIFASQAGTMDLFDWFRDYDVRFFTSSSNSYVVRLRPLNTQSPLIDVGRIGMLVFRAASANADVKVIAVDDPFMLLGYMVYQLKYDSVHGRFSGTIAISEEGKEFLIVNGDRIQVFHEKDPAAIG